jgi:hypothetical protein
MNNNKKPNSKKDPRRQEIGAMGGYARAKKYGPRVRSRWARMGGRPPGIQADILACLKSGPETDHVIAEQVEIRKREESAPTTTATRHTENRVGCRSISG